MYISRFVILNSAQKKGSLASTDFNLLVTSESPLLTKVIKANILYSKPPPLLTVEVHQVPHALSHSLSVCLDNTPEQQMDEDLNSFE